jgi:hypothetical protein
VAARFWGAVGAGAVCLVAAATAACIPDLPQDSQPPANEPLCGNAHIDLDAGEQCDPGHTGGPPTVTGCTPGCQMYCPHGYVSPTNHHCYELAQSSSAGDHDAPRVCSNATNSHVVTFASDDEFDQVAAWADQIDGGPFWVGLQGQSPVPDSYASANVSQPEPGWAPSCPGCYARSVDAGAPLPDYAAGNSAPLCVVAFSDVGHPSWYRSPCNLGSVALHTLCEREPVGSLHAECDAGECFDLVRTYGAKSYVYVSQPASADEASAACHRMGGRLVVLASRDEREQLWHELWLLTVRPARFWIGLADVDPDGPGDDSTWSWDDGVAADAPDAYPSPWAEGQPILDGGIHRAFAGLSAGQVDQTLAFVNEDQAELPFVCELPLSIPDASPH